MHILIESSINAEQKLREEGFKDKNYHGLAGLFVEWLLVRYPKFEKIPTMELNL
jgi:hypothetical protein